VEHKAAVPTAGEADFMDTRSTDAQRSSGKEAAESGADRWYLILNPTLRRRYIYISALGIATLKIPRGVQGL